MNFWNIARPEESPVLKKTLSIMRLTTLFSIACSLQISASVYSQETKLSLDVNNQTIKEVLFRIEKQSGFRFIYESEKVNLNKKVSVHVKEQTVETILKRLFAGEGVKYEITENNFILINPSTKNEKTAPSSQAVLQKKNLVQGVVTDENGEPIIGANVVEKGTTNGTVTDLDGKFTIEVSENGVLQISYIGYAMTELRPSKEANLNVKLREDALQMDEVVVVGYGTVKRANLGGAVSTADAKAFESRPVQNAAQALQGEVPGLTITRTGGSATKGGKYMVSGATNIDQSELFSLTNRQGYLIYAAGNTLYGYNFRNGSAAVELRSFPGEKITAIFNDIISDQKDQDFFYIATYKEGQENGGTLRKYQVIDSADKIEIIDQETWGDFSRIKNIAFKQF